MFKTILLLVVFYAGCFSMSFGFSYLALFAMDKIKKIISSKRLEKQIAYDHRADIRREYYSREKL